MDRDECRTGPALPLRWPFLPRERLENSTSDAPCRLLAQPARVRSNQKARTAATTPSSKDAAFTLRSAFHRQVPLITPLAQDTDEPATVSRGVATCEPASGRSLDLLLNLRQVPACAAPLRQFSEGCTAGGSRLIAPDIRQIGTYRLSTSAISTVPEHDCGLTITLRAWLEVTLRLCSVAGGAASFDALPVELS
jgi:hypothetical protein